MGRIESDEDEPGMALRVLIEGGGVDETATRLEPRAQVGDLFGPLADQHGHHDSVRIALQDGLRRLANQRRLAGLWWRHDERTRPEAERREQIDDARRDRQLPLLQTNAPVWETLPHLLELRPPRRLLRPPIVDALQRDERAPPAAFLSAPRHEVARAQVHAPRVIRVHAGERLQRAVVQDLSRTHAAAPAEPDP